MRISDWSSDVCSSDLPAWAERGMGKGGRDARAPGTGRGEPGTYGRRALRIGDAHGLGDQGGAVLAPDLDDAVHRRAVAAVLGLLDGLSRLAHADARACRHHVLESNLVRTVVDAARTLDLVRRQAGDQRDRKSTRLNSSHTCAPRMPSLAC